MSVPPPIPVARSTFLSVVAWIFIGLSGFSAMISLLQNVMLQLVILPGLQQQPPPPDTPPALNEMLGYMPWLMRGLLLISSIHLIAAIGLLLRKNWGRLLFIGMLVFDILYQLGGIGLQWWLSSAMDSLLQLPATSAKDAAESAQFMQAMHGMIWVMRIFGIVFAAGFAVLFGWIIKRLCSAPIRREFAPPLAG